MSYHNLQLLVAQNCACADKGEVIIAIFICKSGSQRATDTTADTGVLHGFLLSFSTLFYGLFTAFLRVLRAGSGRDSHGRDGSRPRHLARGGHGRGEGDVAQGSVEILVKCGREGVHAVPPSTAVVK